MMAQLVVGKREIAALLGVDRATPAQWMRRARDRDADDPRRLPAPDHPPVNGRDAWRLPTILDWAQRTGRLKGDNT